jgi:glutamyl-tRNA synthetase
MLRVRFAPSPTGYLHVGGARTALFNWLLARHHGGVFVLRIEDTDAERSSWPMVQGILDALRWLGIDWDEGPEGGGSFGPYFQSERFDRHRAMANALVASGHAYYCYCTPDELKARREAGERETGGWKYDRLCCGLAADEIARRERDRVPRAIRFKVPAGTTSFDDRVHGPIAFDGANIEDFILVRSDGLPTYMLSVVSDDVEMEITDVVRGDDHISNTPKQILLYQAVGAPLPRFAHVPLILGPDKKRLSKRHGATSVMEYEKQGYLPEALFNFLALLGWSPGGDQELFTRDELIAAFSLEGVSGGNAVFNPEKLDWFNAQHLARMPLDQLTVRLRPLFEHEGLWDETWAGARSGWFQAVLDLLKPRAKKLHDFVEQGRVFFTDALAFDNAAVVKHLLAPGMDGHLEAADAALMALPVFDAASAETAVRDVAEGRGLKAGALIHAIRVSLTGKTVSPGLFEVMALLGRERAHARLAEALEVIARAGV